MKKSREGTVRPKPRPEPRLGILDINIYKAGASTIVGVDKPAKLSSNETPLGASPKAIAAYERVGATLERYPDSAATQLRQTIGQVLGLDPERIVVGAGSDELLQMIAHAYVGEGDDVLYTEHSFVVYGLVTKSNGANGIVVDEIDCCADVDKILQAISDKTRVVFLANPNNPTGTYLSEAEIDRLHRSLPTKVLLVLDEAYAEYVQREDYASAISLVPSYENIVVTRTFSKIYGLAALRLGWAYCPHHVADVLNRIRGPFNTTAAAQAAGIEAIQDREHVAKAVAHNDQWMRWLEQQLGGLGLDFTRSVGNFILIHFSEGPGRTAQEANAFLLQQGIILRAAPAPNLGHTLRLSIGLEDENRRVIEALREFLEQK
jgi:histidinol-phosphate aminotransferase